MGAVARTSPDFDAESQRIERDARDFMTSATGRHGYNPAVLDELGHATERATVSIVKGLRTIVRRIGGATAGIVLSLGIADLAGHAYYRVRHHTFLWNDDESHAVFRIRPITALVNDDQLITLKKDFSLGDVATDANGFRIGSNSYQGKARDIVFLGDSVPFGWGARADDTVPSRFARLLDSNARGETGVINAAVPSYSLYQSVRRYVREVDAKFPVSAIILQTWDPATQLARNGKSWTREMNWTTHGTSLTVPEWALQQPEWAKYSSLVHYSLRAFYRGTLSGPGLSPDDEQTRARFAAENERTLRELTERLERADIVLYLVSANPAPGVTENYPRLATALRWMNESLLAYASKTPRTHFVDLEGPFDLAGRKNLFIDDCCHLSDAGAELEARIVYDAMSQNGDIP